MLAAFAVGLPVPVGAKAAHSAQPARPGLSSGKAFAIKEENALYSFDYAWPAAAGAIPGLRTWLEAQRDRMRAELIALAKETRTYAVRNKEEFRPQAKGMEWQKVAEIPGWLSLSAQGYEYTGGAHPNSWSDSLVWDKAANQRRAVTDLFTSKAALDRAIQADFCARLDAERAVRRQEKVNRASGDEFDTCIAPSEQTVILGSSNGKAFDRIGVLVAPYNAGPYAEGPYEITVQVTPALIGAAKPAFRKSFAAR